MSKFDRFHPPEAEPSATCVGCGGQAAASDMLYDELAEHYICDAGCYGYWAGKHAEDVAMYYYRMNIE